MKNIDLCDLLHATYNDNRVKQGQVTTQASPEDTLALQLQDQRGEVVGTLYASVADEYPDTLLWTLYAGYGTIQLEQWHYDFSEDADYDKGARSIVDEAMKDLADFGLTNRGEGNA